MSQQLQGPTGLPLVGVLPSILKQDTLTLLRESQAEYGDLFKMRVGPLSLYVAAHPDYARHILQTNVSNYTKGAVYEPGRVWMIRNGLVANNGEFWLKQRRMMQPHFHRQQLKGLTEMMTRTITEVLDSWTELAEQNKTMDLEPQMARITMRVIMQALFGNNYLSDEEMVQVSGAFATLIRRLTPRLFLYFIPKWFPLPGDSQLRTARRVIDRAIYKAIRIRRAAPKEGSDLISMLISAVDDESNERMDDEQLRDEVVTLFLAGFDTTSTALAWTWYLLDQHPEVLTKLESEVATLGGQTPNFESLRALPYTRMVLEEAMRLYPPVGIIPRTAVKADELGGYPIPAGATIWLFIYGIHHHSGSWPQAERFIPERFSPEAKKQQHRFAYIPFIAGPRQCIGAEFALMQSTLVLAMTLQRYRLGIAAKVTPQLTTVLKAREGLRAHLTVAERLHTPEHQTLRTITPYHSISRPSKRERLRK